MVSGGGGPIAKHNADDAWLRLENRLREVLEWRHDGLTLDVVGQRLGVSRERARQLERSALDKFLDSLREQLPALKAAVHSAFGNAIALHDDALAQIIGADQRPTRNIILRELGLIHPRASSGQLEEWWEINHGSVAQRLKTLVGMAPCTDQQLQRRIKELDLPAGMAVLEILAGASSRILRTNVGWVRRRNAVADRTFLWLREHGEPARIEHLASEIGRPFRSLAEVLRRDSRFAQIRPDGTWVLADWRDVQPSRPYESTLDVMLEILGEMGPLDLQALTAETIRRYPVTVSRVTQCLSSIHIGRTNDGLYDLTERGAQPLIENEPTRPNNMVESQNGRLIAVSLRVDADITRGSGIGVNRWLTWRLGMHNFPALRRFSLDQPPGELIVRRGTTASISTLRAAVLSMGLGTGCRIAVLISPLEGRAALRHICGSVCPNDLSGPENL